MILFFQNHEKNAPFGILSDELGCVFFLTNIEKTHPKSSPKISLNIPNLSCPSQKSAPFFLTILRKNKDHWKRLIIISLIYCMKIPIWWTFFLGPHLSPKWSKKKVRFFEMDMINLEYLGRFWVTNRDAFFQYSWKKKRTPIRHSKSQKVRFFHDFEKK